MPRRVPTRTSNVPSTSLVPTTTPTWTLCDSNDGVPSKGGPNGGGTALGAFPLPLLATAAMDLRGPDRPWRLSYAARLSRTALRAAACRRGSIVVVIVKPPREARAGSSSWSIFLASSTASGASSFEASIPSERRTGSSFDASYCASFRKPFSRICPSTNARRARARFRSRRGE